MNTYTITLTAKEYNAVMIAVSRLEEQLHNAFLDNLWWKLSCCKQIADCPQLREPKEQ